MNTRSSASSSTASVPLDSPETSRVSTLEVISSTADRTLLSGVSVLTSPTLAARSDRISWRIFSSKLTR